MNPPADFEFRWLSPLGISLVLLLGYGVLNTLVGLVIPFLSRRTGTAGFATQPTLDLITMLWLAFGLVQLGLLWFGARLGLRWAFWTAVVADAVQLFGWALYGSQTRDWTAPLFWYDCLFLLPAIVLGWIGWKS
jgi:hypothetical protein